MQWENFRMSNKSVYNKLVDPVKAKKDKEMVYNVFLSFDWWRDREVVKRFRERAEKKRLPLRFYEHTAYELTSALSLWYRDCELKISRCSVTICLIGLKTYQCKGVDWELRKSIELGKNIIGVYLVDDELLALPEVLYKESIPVVSWNMEEIMNAIRKVAR